MQVAGDPDHFRDVDADTATMLVAHWLAKRKVTRG